MSHMLFRYLRQIIVAYCLLVLAFIASGLLTTQRIGEMTWGPTTDFWAATIAISDIELGMDGGLGRRELSLAMAKILSTSGSDISVHDAETRERVKNPVLVTEAFKAAAAIKPDMLKPVTLDSGMITTTVFEDIGFADFYDIAFRLFGYDAFATYHLYMLFLVISVALFMVGQWHSASGLSVLALGLSGLFILTTSSIFTGLALPSLTANRALASLAVIPLLNIAVAAFDTRGTWPSRIATVLQMIMLALAVSLRSSAVWGVLGLAVILCAIVAIRCVMVLRNGTQGNFASEFFLAAWSRRAVYTLVAALIVFGGYSAVRSSQLHFLYDTDDVLPHHLRWHSAYIALSGHPDFAKYQDFFKAEGLRGDSIAFSEYLRYMAEQFPNSPPRTKVTGLHKMRLHDAIMKERFLDFAGQQPRFIAELYLVHKPKRYFAEVKSVLASIPLVAWLLTLPAIVLNGLAFVGDRFSIRRALPSVAALYGASLLPYFWAYASSHAMADHLMMVVVLAYMIAGAVIVSLGRLLIKR